MKSRVRRRKRISVFLEKGFVGEPGQVPQSSSLVFVIVGRVVVGLWSPVVRRVPERQTDLWLA